MVNAIDPSDEPDGNGAQEEILPLVEEHATIGKRQV